MSKIKLIVGLANPGSKYIATRHNAGSWYVDFLATSYNQCLKEDNRFFGYSAFLNIGGQGIRLLVPTTFMNLSGKSVSAIATFYHIAPEEILIAHDELNLPPGVAKFKHGGSHGGHNGLKDIIRKLGNNRNFHRLRIGVGHPRDRDKVISFLLGKPQSVEKTLIENVVDKAAHCTEIWIKEGLLKAMNHLHRYKASVQHY